MVGRVTGDVADAGRASPLSHQHWSFLYMPIARVQAPATCPPQTAFSHWMKQAGHANGVVSQEQPSAKNEHELMENYSSFLVPQWGQFWDMCFPLCPRSPQWDLSPVAHSGTCPMIHSVLASFSSLSCFPSAWVMFPGITSQIHNLHSCPCPGVSFWG